ncbi:hypothetical protein EDE11_1652 [Methylomonas methanica]|uniref:Terminase n=3 Tax=Methylomonas TaxID=416 RepID=A0A140E5F3_9GAMM|nr:hypothetical protein [Methylomonas methanica]AMK75387.1 hypothetical protein JT25_002600 [Methylomonas denitrificans]AMK75627.1 hypothetical protein JT25_003850 [Methylomonas denitrificans]OAI06258.1 hypothetical protein A1342_22450 [Methylomonas methanica]TCV71020.1 hypothetical protein EDE11_1652 [Methylomonas methanica]
MTTETPKKSGRPKVDWHERAKQAYNYALLGADDTQIAKLIGISESTLENAKQEKPGFAKAIKSGRIQAAAEVAASLYRRCSGFQETEVTTREIKSPTGEIISVETVTIAREVPPDTDACVFWLTNRRPDLWRNTVEVEHTGKAYQPDDEESKKEAAAC